MSHNHTIRPVLTASDVAMLATAIESHISYRASAMQESAFDIESYKVLKRKLDVALAKLGISTPEYTTIRAADASAPKTWTPAQCYMKYLEACASPSISPALPHEVLQRALEYKIENGESYGPLTAEENAQYMKLMGL